MQSEGLPNKWFYGPVILAGFLMYCFDFPQRRSGSIGYYQHYIISLFIMAYLSALWKSKAKESESSRLGPLGETFCLFLISFFYGGFIAVARFVFDLLFSFIDGIV